MFFKQIFEHLQGSGTALNITIAVVENDMTVSVKIQPFSKGKKESAFDKLAPVIITGTADELDADFISTIGAPIKRATGGIQVNVEEFDKSVEEAKEEESGSSKSSSKKSSSSKSTSKSTPVKKKPAPAFMKKLQPTKALGAMIGDNPMPRTEAMKKLWEYVKKNELQGKKDKRKITLDSKMQKVFGDKKTISMFDMTKKMAEHLKEVKDDAPKTEEKKVEAPKKSAGQAAIDAATTLAAAKTADGYKQAWGQLESDLQKNTKGPSFFSKAEVTIAEQLIFDWKKAKMMLEAEMEEAPTGPGPVTESDDITIPATEKKKPVAVEKVPVITEDVTMDTPLADALDENLSDVDETVEPPVEDEVDDDF